jgi:hypothetical protein
VSSLCKFYECLFEDVDISANYCNAIFMCHTLCQSVTIVPPGFVIVALTTIFKAKLKRIVDTSSPCLTPFLFQILLNMCLGYYFVFAFS